MKMTLRTLLFAAVLGFSLLLTACGGGSGGAATGGSGTAVDIGSDGENLAFDKTELTAKAGDSITLNFKNNSAAQQHNWVLVNGGDDVARSVDEGGLQAGASANYLPGDQANVVASSKLLNGGESDSVTFTAPAAGTYKFICTVPGHYPLMQGTLTVN